MGLEVNKEWGGATKQKLKQRVSVKSSKDRVRDRNLPLLITCSLSGAKEVRIWL